MTQTFFKPATALTVALAATMAFSGCEGPMTTGQKALAGAAAGAAAGALLTGHGRGALVGAGLGAAAGALIGHAQTEERGGYSYERRGYPYGRPADQYGFVISPYYPHNIIDVRGIPRGVQVIDPSVNRIFINP